MDIFNTFLKFENEDGTFQLICIHDVLRAGYLKKPEIINSYLWTALYAADGSIIQ